MPSVVIIDYGSGNIRSVAKAFERVCANVTVTSEAKKLSSASHIVLPGVGAFADCMKGLSAIPDMLPSLHKEVIENKKWFLGVCVGMQMLFEVGHEHGTHKGLGWLKGEVIPINQQLTTSNQQPLKIPHMGWNELHIEKSSPIVAGINNGDHAYFVHSYHAKLTNKSDLIASTQYGETITAIIGKDNIFGTQFHPEKSQKTGLEILENFVKL